MLSLQSISQNWIDAWNTLDLPTILAHYSPSLRRFTSPRVRQIARATNNAIGDASGIITSFEALKQYFQHAIKTVGSSIRLELIDVCTGVREDEVVVVYRRENGVVVSERMVVDADGKAVEVECFYSGGAA